MTPVHNSWMEGSKVVVGEPLRCIGCGSDQLIALKPGHDPTVFMGIIVDPGAPGAAWCASCWPALRAAA